MLPSWCEAKAKITLQSLLLMLVGEGESCGELDSSTMSTLSGATRSPDAMSRKNTVATLIALQECTERQRTVVGMCSAKVGSRCAKCFSDVLAAVGPHVLLSDGSLFRGRLNSLTKISPPQSGFVLLFFCSRVCVCVCVCDTAAAGRRGGPLSAPPRANLFGSRSRAGGAVQWQLGIIHLVGAADQTQ